MDTIKSKASALHNKKTLIYCASLPVDRDINAALRYSKNVLWDFNRDSHLPGEKWTYARAALYEC